MDRIDTGVRVRHEWMVLLWMLHVFKGGKQHLEISLAKVVLCNKCLVLIYG